MKYKQHSLFTSSRVVAISLAMASACALEGDDDSEDQARSAVMEVPASDALELDNLEAIDGSRLRGANPEGPEDVKQQEPEPLPFTKSGLGFEGPGCGPGSNNSVRADFDGDGFDDLAVGVPNEGVGDDKPMAGAINVIYGEEVGEGEVSEGLDTPNDQYLTQDDIDGDSAELGDHFGWALAAGDFNNDGRSDLAVGVPDEDIGNIVDAGALHVLYGSDDPDDALQESGADFFDQGDLGEAIEANDRFGFTLTVGNFNGDEYDDLAVGVPLEDLEGGSWIELDAGQVHIIYGSQNGLDVANAKVLTQTDFGSSPMPADRDYFGAALTAGNFDGDTGGVMSLGLDDLAIGVPGADDGAEDAGRVNVFYNHGTSAAIINQVNTDTITAEDFDRFGSSLSVGNFDDDDKDDLVVGVPYEDRGGVDSGVVVVLFDADPTMELLLFQERFDTTASEAFDYFGLSLATGDFDDNHGDDLAIGAPGTDVETTSDIKVDAGQVYVAYSAGSQTFDTTDDSGEEDRIDVHIWNQRTGGIEGIVEDLDNFGASLTAGDYDNNGHWDLTIGVPGEDVGSLVDAGWVNVIYGGRDSSNVEPGLHEDDDQVWHQNKTGIKDDAEAGDSFACSLR